MFAIFDLDNCISDDSFRIPRIRWATSDADARYWDYHSLCGFDEIFNEDFLLKHRREGHKIIFSTGRPVTVRAITEEWLRRKCKLETDQYILLQRNVGDFRPSQQLKEMHLRWLEGHYDIDVASQVVAAYDDRVDVVRMWHRNGISGARQLFIHEVDAYTNPLTGKDMHERRAD